MTQVCKHLQGASTSQDFFSVLFNTHEVVEYPVPCNTEAHPGLQCLPCRENLSRKKWGRIGQGNPYDCSLLGQVLTVGEGEKLEFSRSSRISFGILMSEQPQEIYVIRHGETEWSLSGQHTGTTDLPLTENGQILARRLKPLIANHSFDLILTSPLQRARETCLLSGLGEKAEVDSNLVEWNYGEYEGLTSQEIHEKRPGWMIFTDGCPGGETPEQVGTRADRVIGRVRMVTGDVALFAHGHILRVLVARWIGLSAPAGRHFLLHTGTLNVLSYYRGIPAVKIWNAPLIPAE